MTKEAAERSFDELASGLASGTLSRGRALKLMGAALVGGALAAIPGVVRAAPPCPRTHKFCGKSQSGPTCCAKELGETCCRVGKQVRCCPSDAPVCCELESASGPTCETSEAECKAAGGRPR